MSVHRVDVVRIGPIEKHPNADSLGITRIMGFTIVVRLAEWKEGDLGAYIQPDSIVDSSRAEFAFLAGHERIRVKRLRGVFSMGLLVPAPTGAVPGDDVATVLNVKHYEPPIANGNVTGNQVSPPALFVPKYDVENVLRFAEALTRGERVVVTEKIHGANMRIVFTEGKLFVGSRTQWLAEDPPTVYWRALRATPALITFAEEHPDIIAFGEVYGPVQDLKYGLKEPAIALFDLMVDGAYLGWDRFQAMCKEHNLPMAPFLGEYAFDPSLIEGEFRALAERDSLVATAPAKHIREGVVIRSAEERWSDEIGRVQLKLISNRYLES